MRMSRKYKLLFLAIFLLSVLLRLGLTLVNRQANDDHTKVVELILQTHQLPLWHACGECIQPKLFHFTAAMIIESIGLANASRSTLILAIQLINFVAGLISIVIIWIFIYKLPFRNEFLKLMAFALAALNPALIGINAQATNDTFAILFSTLALYFTYLYCQEPRLRSFFLLLLFTLLGIASKANAWVTAIAIFLVLLVQLYLRKPSIKTAALFSAAFLVLVPGLTILNPVNQYIVNYQNFGTPVPTKVRPPLPYLFKLTPGCEPRNKICRPGILSVKSGFFTFSYISLIEHPRNEGEGEDYPAFQTSFWTFMYAGAHSIHFLNYPDTWTTTGDEGFAISRCIFVLALLPTLFLLIGLAIEVFLFLKGLFRRAAGLIGVTSHGLFAISFIGYLLFVALYSYIWRDFSYMKAIFAFPALLTFPLLFLRAAEPLYDFLSRRKIRWGAYLLNTALIALLAFYVLDVSSMIIQIHQLKYLL